MDSRHFFAVVYTLRSNNHTETREFPLVMGMEYKDVYYEAQCFLESVRGVSAFVALWEVWKDNYSEISQRLV